MRVYEFAPGTPFEISTKVLGCPSCGLHIQSGELEQAIADGRIESVPPRRDRAKMNSRLRTTISLLAVGIVLLIWLLLVR